MSDSKIETMQGMCAVDITKYIMRKMNCEADVAFSKFIKMELYKLLMDTNSGMYLEQNEFLFDCCEAELEHGIDALYRLIDVEYDYEKI